MIRRIIWNPAHSREESPFLQASQRPLRITFHSESLVNLSNEESEAIQQLRHLSHLWPSDIAILNTKAGDAPYISIGPINKYSDDILVRIITQGAEDSITDIPFREQWLRIALGLLPGKSSNDPDVMAMHEALILARAHIAARGNILITKSHWLLNNRASTWIDEANPYTPLEASQLIGLFLRSRYRYEVCIAQKCVSFDRSFFYHILARYKLPNMWRYIAACAAKSDDTRDLALTIVTRCIRALQTRDTIGELFYVVPQSYGTLDTMSYYFDYLTLLLAGTFDAQARIAWFTNTYTTPVHQANFRIRKPHKGKYQSASNAFLNELRRVNPCLWNLVSAQSFQDFTILLYELRNNIHGRLPEELIESDKGGIKTPFILLHHEHKTELQRAAMQYTSMEDWGLVEKSYNLVLDSDGHTEHHIDFLIEPYTYACTLIREGFKWIDRIATATDISGLLPSGQTVTQLPSGPPPGDAIFNDEIGRHVAYLGWIS
jgi:hypothetical protein